MNASGLMVSGHRAKCLAAAAALLVTVGWSAAASAQTCLGDVAGSLNCTANDFTISSITVSQVLDDGCVGEGDTFTFNGSANFGSGSADRFDVGLYIGADGDQAQTGTCSVHIIPAGGASNDDGDTCGDYDGTSISVPMNNVTSVCTDNNGDGFFDLAICTAWHQNGSPTCSGIADALPGTASKCDCSQVETDIEIPHCDTNADCAADANVCTTAVCVGLADPDADFFGCEQQNNTAACDDGLFCNGTDTCSNGSCSQHTGDPCTGAGTCSVCNEGADNCFASGATVCRASAGVCDQAENCTGSSTTCPGDTFTQGGTCRAANGVCDVAETCDGSSADCPANAFTSGGTCRAANGVCDVAETCSGASADCPGDTFTQGGTCRAANGVCDVAEACDGSSADCPADGYASTAVECRADAGVCDVAENCDGSSADCPGDGFEPAGTTCTSDGNECTDDECDGNGACVNTNNTDPCNDGLFCTTGDACSGGSCSGSATNCDDDVECTQDTCDEDADACDNAPDDGFCDDGDPCTDDICSAVNGCISDLICGDICRSPGYWSTHSGGEKEGSTNVGQLLLDTVGDIEVCGQTISATVNAQSPWVEGLGLTSNLEGLCMRSKGVHQRQLYRQLVAAALNCEISAGSDCEEITNRYIDVSYDDCDDLCETSVEDEGGPSVGECIHELACFNSGGQIVNGDCATGTCASQPDVLCGKDYGSPPDFESLPQECVRFEDNCHDNIMCNEPLGFCPKATPASSPKACHEARFNECTIDSCE